MSERPSATDARGHFRRLAAQVDEFFERVAQRHGEQMDCARGCRDCCAPNLTVTTLEAEVIREHIDGLDRVSRRALAADAADPPADRCVALDAEGACRIYEARPIVCRSHGVPILERPDRQRLPVLSVCHRNFREEGALEATAADCRLDAAGLSVRLLAINSAHADATGKPRGARVALATLLGET